MGMWREPGEVPESDEEDEEEEVKMVEGDADLARKVFQRAYNDLKSKGVKSEVWNFGKLKKQSPNSCGFSVSLYLKFGRHLKRRTAQKTMSRKSRVCSLSSARNAVWTRKQVKLLKVRP